MTMNDIDLAKSIIKEIDCGYISYGNLHNNQDEGLKLIKAALEKQIPKKPKQFEDGWLTWHCSTCGLEVGSNMKYKEHHCKCGQLIDWSEEK